MAVVSVKPIIADWSSERNRQNRNRIATHYEVLTNDQQDGPDAISTNPQLPQPDETYSFGNDSNSALVFGNQSFTRSPDNALAWIVTTTWENRPESEDDESEKDNNDNPVSDPLLAQDRITMSMATFQEPALFALNQVPLPSQVGGNAFRAIDTEGPVQVSSGEIVDPPVMRDAFRWILRIARNSATANMDAAEQYVHSVNSVPLTVNRLGFTKTIPLRKGKIASITPERRSRGAFIFWTITYEFHIWPSQGAGQIQDRTWIWEQKDIANTAAVYDGAPDGEGGTYNAARIAAEFPAGVPKLRTLKDGQGLPYPKPVILNTADGQPAEPGVAAGDIPYKIYTEKDWTPLGLWD